MRRLNHNVSRRVFVLGAAGSALLIDGGHSAAQVVTGIAALDTAAIAVRQPSRVILIAVARAGNRLVAAGEHGVIIYSDDDAASWRQAAVPVDVNLTCIAFAGPMIGWAAGHFGVILNTVDGGQTWREQLNGLQANQLTMDAAQAAISQSSSAAGAPLALKRASIFLSSGPSKPFLSLLSLGPEKAIAFGAYRMTMLTTDGGTTWQDWSLHIDDKFSHNLYDAVQLGADIYLAGESGLVFCSTDGGNNFAPVASPSNATIFGLLGIRGGGLIAYGVAGTCFMTQDGGKSWTPIALATQENITAGCELPNGQILLATLSGVIFLSRDNGTTFQPVPGLPPMTISDVVLDSDQALIFVGYAGVTRIQATKFDN
jgi:photosystem II stability/assembly factor-like uncharacterized protein